MEESFIEEEVYATLLELGGDKALGPNDFPLALWQHYWDFLKNDVLGLFKEFHTQGSFERSLNAMFLDLIPEKAGAEDLKTLDRLI